MADLSPDALAHVARIARLALTPEERARLAAEASTILAHFEAVMAAGAGEKEEQRAPIAPRADEPREPDRAQADAIVAQFPRKDARLAKAPGGP